MPRQALALSLALLVLAGGARTLAPVLAQEGDPKPDPKATEDYNAFAEWLKAEDPKTPKEREALSNEVVKRCRAFLKAHPDSGTPTYSIKDILADVLYKSKKFSEAQGLWEALLKAKEDVYAAKGRIGVVKCLIQTDRKQARARLEGYLKDQPDDPGLKAEDKYLKDNPEVATKGLKAGEAPPAIVARSLAGADVSLEKLKGTVVLVDFWATWCPPCKQELPDLKKLYSELHGKGFEILGVDFAEKEPATLADFVRKEQIGWPQIVADARPIARAYEVKSLPRTVLIDKEGKIAAVDLRGDQLHKAIRALVEGKPIPEEKPVAASGESKGDDENGKGDEGGMEGGKGE